MAGALCEAIKWVGCSICPQEFCAHLREHQAYVSKIFTNYWLFLGSWVHLFHNIPMTQTRWALWSGCRLKGRVRGIWSNMQPGASNLGLWLSRRLSVYGALGDQPWPIPSSRELELGTWSLVPSSHTAMWPPRASAVGLPVSSLLSPSLVTLTFWGWRGSLWQWDEVNWYLVRVIFLLVLKIKYIGLPEKVIILKFKHDNT